MLTVADVTDCVSNGSTVSVSPVKRLITMYNSNGVADKKSRRKAKASNKSQNTKDNLEVARKGCDELNVQHNLTNSGENSPYSGSDSSSCSTDDQIVDTSLSKPLKRGLSLSIDISRDNSTDPNEIFWEISDFSLDTAIYESSKFDHANQTWNFSFGHNNADGYGYILCLYQPQIDPLHLQCTFNMHNSCKSPYSKTREEAYVFGINSMNSRGFVNFASREAVKRHIEMNGNLKLSATMKVVTGTSPLRSKNDDVSIGCYRLSETRSYSICGDNPRLSMKGYCGDSSTLAKEINRSKSLLREADCHVDRLNSGRHIAQNSSSPVQMEVLGTPDYFEENYSSSSSQPNTPTRLLCPISFQPFIAFQGLYASTSCEIDICTTEEALQRSPTGLIAPPYIPITRSCAGSESSVAEEVEKVSHDHGHDHDHDHGSTKVKSNEIADGSDDSSNLPRESDRSSTDDVQGGASGCNQITGKETASNSNSCYDRGKVSSSTDVSVHGAASPLITITDSDRFDSKCLIFTCRDGSRVDHVSNLLMPCTKDVSHDLLADSLRTVAQHSRSIESNYSLSRSNHGLHPSPKHISLTLPFKEIITSGNRLEDTPDCGTSAEFGDDGSSNIDSNRAKIERNHQYHNDLQSSLTSEIGLNLDPEISPISPSYIYDNDLYGQQNILPGLGAAVSPTVIEGPRKSALIDKDLSTPNPVSEVEDLLPGEVLRTLDCPDFQGEKSCRLSESNNNVNNYVLNEPITCSKEKVVKGKVQWCKGGPNMRPIVVGNSPSFVKINSRTRYPLKLVRKSAYGFRHNKSRLDVKTHHTNQILGSILLAGVGVYMNQQNINKIMLQIIAWIYSAFTVTMKSVSVLVILGLVLALDKKKERER